MDRGTNAVTMTLQLFLFLCLLSSSVWTHPALSQNNQAVISPSLNYLHHPHLVNPPWKPHLVSNQRHAVGLVAPAGRLVAPPGSMVAQTGSLVAPVGSLVAPAGRLVAPSQFRQRLQPSVPLIGTAFVTAGHRRGPLAVPKPRPVIQAKFKSSRSQLAGIGQPSRESASSSNVKLAEFFVKRLSRSQQGRDILERLDIKQVRLLDSALVRRITRVVFGLKASSSGRELLQTLELGKFMGLPRLSSADPGFRSRMTVLDFAPITFDYRNRAIDDLFLRAYGGLANYGQEVLSIAPGYITTELDMCLTREQFHYMYDKRPFPQPMPRGYRLVPSFIRKRYKRKAIKHFKYRWPDTVIPYEFNYDDFSWSEIMLIERSMYEWEEHTCVRFKMKMPEDTNYIRFRGGVGCSSHVGMIGGAQNVTLQSECRIKRIVLHEIGHAIGLIHEHQRPDRDEYIVIHYENASPGTRWDFEKRSWSTIRNYSVPYDYESVMHYGPKAFSKDGKKETILTKDARFQNTIGKVTELSFYDMKVVNLMYNCDGHCEKGVTCTDGGFMNRYCKCICQNNKPCKAVKVSRTPVQSKNVYLPWRFLPLWPWQVLRPVNNFNVGAFPAYSYDWSTSPRNHPYRKPVRGRTTIRQDSTYNGL